MAINPISAENIASTASRVVLDGGDEMGIFGENFSPLFGALRILETANIASKKVMEHPLETGAVIADHQISQPKEVMINALLDADDFSVFEALKNAYEAGQAMTVQVRGGVYKSMIISEMPHKEDADYFRQLRISLKFKEVVTVSPEYGSLPAKKVAHGKDASTVKRGTQSATGGKSGTPANRSWLAKSFG